MSPDGTILAYGCARVDGPAPHDLCLQPVAAGAARNLTGATIDRPINQPKWIDNQTLVVSVARGFQTSVEIVGRDGTAHRIDGVSGNVSAFARTTDGTIAYVSETASAAPELWIKTANAPARAVTVFNEKWASRPAAAAEFVKYKSADGTEIEAALLKPSALSSQPSAVNAQPGPAVILVHGGPTGRWADNFEAVGTAAGRARIRGAVSQRARLDRLRPSFRRDEPG